MSKKSGSSNSRERILQMLDETIGDSNSISATVDALKKLPIDDIKRMQEGKFDNFTGSSPVEDELEFPEGPYFLHFTPKNKTKKELEKDKQDVLEQPKKKKRFSIFLAYLHRAVQKKFKSNK
ncbi:hypothetical protein P4575_04790 [Priestia megaterium]|uniref:hypothetical protein n=1 Tax=Priestia megaterium TaxID=1404 RepID=UPI002E1BDE99|nr:hypothetical protein [Priestia megaterium]